MFKIVKETVEIENKDGTKDSYTICPLGGEYLEDLYYVMGKFQGIEDGGKSTVEILGTDAVAKLHRLVFASLRNEYKDIDDKALSQFVSQNLFRFVEPVMKVNIPS